MNFGSPEIRDKVVPEVFSGKKFICLAISEAFAGSDVQGLKTYAKKTEDGKFWIVNGTKKWITNGTYVHFPCFVGFGIEPDRRFLVGSATSECLLPRSAIRPGTE